VTFKSTATRSKGLIKIGKRARVYDGSQWQDLVSSVADLTPYSTTAQMNTAIDNAKGLVLISSTTIGTAVSTVTITNCFNSTYDAYKVIILGGVGSATGDIHLSLGGITTGYYSNYIYQPYSSGSITGGADSNQSKWTQTGNASANGITLSVDLISPNLAKFKRIFSFWGEVAASGNTGTMTGICSSTAQATDLVIFPRTGTLTGGTISIYGYKK